MVAQVLLQFCSYDNATCRLQHQGFPLPRRAAYRPDKVTWEDIACEAESGEHPHFSERAHAPVLHWPSKALLLPGLAVSVVLVKHCSQNIILADVCAANQANR